ncbi:MAG TPA: 4Fe-4S dicluster domain-containing protein [Bacteroidales bacterium]|nr:4Fe-4S dicluster domain-containing protein [Bacteroidales bacterium]
MNEIYRISLEDWKHFTGTLSSSFNVYAPVEKNGFLDYTRISPENSGDIVYNRARPASPLKIFFLPVKLNVTVPPAEKKNNIIIGAPSCDVEGLKLLDLIYLDEKFFDGIYFERRMNTVLISSDCYETADSCHCVAYDVNPYSEKGCDINLSADNEYFYLHTCSEKGDRFINEHIAEHNIAHTVTSLPSSVLKRRNSATRTLINRTSKLPGNKETADRVKNEGHNAWYRYSSRCVSCGACSAICPTCTCFLLIDRPEFEKIKQLDTCQYPSFQRVAGGEDPLKELGSRFRNRYMCKFVWKPERFGTLACTGCGRCIDACIAGISKNELIMELA